MKTLRTEIIINAPPAVVWQALTESSDWGAWNSFIVTSSGRYLEGEKLSNTMVMGSGKRMTFKPTVLVAEPGKELRWLGRVLMPGIFDGEHYFQMEAVPEGTRFVHGEIFRGILIGMLDMQDVENCFNELNQGLKKKAESA